MKHSNFTIFRKLTPQNKFANLFCFFFLLTMFFSNFSLFAKIQTTSIELFLSSTSETCQSSSDGSASVVVAGGIPAYSYSWSSGDTTDVAYGLTMGTYTVTVTDSQGETAEGSVDVELSDEGLWIMVSTTQDADCGPNGIAHVSAMTGVPPYTYQWNDPDMQTTEDAINLYFGTYSVTVTDSNGCSADSSTVVNGVDGISIGDFVFRDHNEDGIQDPLEGGVSNVYVALFSAGPDGIILTSDDILEDSEFTGSDGYYLFECVDPGLHIIRFGINTEEYNYSPQYQGSDDEKDSNADPLTGNTESFVVTQGMPDDLSFDAGIFDACDDFTYGGTIGLDQVICAGEEAETLGTVIPPSGGSGTPEYLWLQSTSGGSFPNPSWMEIPNSNTENYNPGILYTTTFYIRCIRREGCNTFIIESANYVTITVLPADHEFCIEDGINSFETDITADIIAAEEVMILWTTGPENELFNYYIERSVDEVNFEEISMVRGNANNISSNNYHFMDTKPKNGRNIYRIKRLELISNTSIYSNSVEVFFVSGDQLFMLYPNPVSNLLNVETSQTRLVKTNFSLFNAMGQLLKVYEMDPSETSIEINMKDLATGLYFIYISDDNDANNKVLKVLKK